MYKMLGLAITIFLCMVVYDNVRDTSQPTAPVQKQEEKNEPSRKRRQSLPYSLVCCHQKKNGPHLFINSILPLIWTMSLNQ